MATFLSLLIHLQTDEVRCTLQAMMNVSTGLYRFRFFLIRVVQATD